MEPQIQKQDAAEAVLSARSFIRDAGILREVAEFIEEHINDGGCDAHDYQIDVLRRTADNLSASALSAIDFADDYFLQEPKKRTKKQKLVVAKAA